MESYFVSNYYKEQLIELKKMKADLLAIENRSIFEQEQLEWVLEQIRVM
jgi:hypothetical protein